MKNVQVEGSTGVYVAGVVDACGKGRDAKTDGVGERRGNHFQCFTAIRYQNVSET